jgi:hypothetical protein
MTGSASLQIQIWPIDRLVFYARNPRKNDAAVDRLVRALNFLGETCSTHTRKTCPNGSGTIFVRGFPLPASLERTASSVLRPCELLGPSPYGANNAELIPWTRRPYTGGFHAQIMEWPKCFGRPPRRMPFLGV